MTKAIDDLFTRRWVCQVLRSGFHNGCPCAPGDPHDGDWGCGYRWECSLTDAHAAAVGLTDWQTRALVNK